MRAARCSAAKRCSPTATMTLLSPRLSRTIHIRSGGHPRELAEPVSTSAVAPPASGRHDDPDSVASTPPTPTRLVSIHGLLWDTRSVCVVDLSGVRRAVDRAHI